jgi:hypothetical protein
MSAASRASSLARLWVARLLYLLEEPYMRIRRMRMMRQSARGSTGRSRRWRRRRSTVILEIISYAGAIALVVIVVWSIVVMLIGPGILTRLNERCTTYSAACGTDIGILIPLLLVAPASAIFLFRRLRLAKKARTMPQQLLETATPESGEIVGRDELCRVIIEDIRHPRTRRPHLLVGGTGTGKTKVLARLHGLLGECRAIPVLIRWQEATDDLNFQEMAHTRFLAIAKDSMRSADDAEKAWTQLSKDDQIIVIADGLEALT